MNKFCGSGSDEGNGRFHVLLIDGALRDFAYIS
jgi:hypothetical protein